MCSCCAKLIKLYYFLWWTYTPDISSSHLVVIYCLINAVVQAEQKINVCYLISQSLPSIVDLWPARVNQALRKWWFCARFSLQCLHPLVKSYLYIFFAVLNFFYLETRAWLAVIWGLWIYSDEYLLCHLLFNPLLISSHNSPHMSEKVTASPYFTALHSPPSLRLLCKSSGQNTPNCTVKHVHRQATT